MATQWVFSFIREFWREDSLTKSPEPPYVSLANQRVGPLFFPFPTPEVIIMGVPHPN